MERLNKMSSITVVTFMVGQPAGHGPVSLGTVVLVASRAINILGG